jgi:hypothetical protein
MSTETAPSGPDNPGSANQGRTTGFGDYVAQLIRVLASGAPGSLQRLRAAVGTQKSCLRLGDELILAYFDDLAEGATFHVEPLTQLPAGLPWGGTDSLTVLALLHGEIELRDAVLAGYLDAQGRVEQVTAIMVAIEILIDAATRVPALSALARSFRNAHGRDGRFHRAPDPREAATAGQLALLDRLDLL